jgi:hypothetical protein
MAKRTTIEIPDYGLNPFVSAMRVHVTKVVEKAGNVHYTEHEPYCKMFRNIDARERILALNSIGDKLLKYIMLVIEPAHDVIKITPDKFNEWCNVKSNKTLYNGVKDLQLNGVIMPVAGNRCTYFINPTVIYCGSRPDNYSDNIVIKSTWKK